MFIQKCYKCATRRFWENIYPFCELRTFGWLLVAGVTLTVEFLCHCYFVFGNKYFTEKDIPNLLEHDKEDTLDTYRLQRFITASLNKCVWCASPSLINFYLWGSLYNISIVLFCIVFARSHRHSYKSYVLVHPFITVNFPNFLLFRTSAYQAFLKCRVIFCCFNNNIRNALTVVKRNVIENVQVLVKKVILSLNDMVEVLYLFYINSFYFKFDNV